MNRVCKYVKRLEELDSIGLKMRRLREYLIVMFSYLMGRHREDGAKLLPEMNCEMTRGNGHDLLQRKIR